MILNSKDVPYKSYNIQVAHNKTTIELLPFTFKGLKHQHF